MSCPSPARSSAQLGGHLVRGNLLNDIVGVASAELRVHWQAENFAGENLRIGQRPGPAAKGRIRYLQMNRQRLVNVRADAVLPEVRTQILSVVNSNDIQVVNMRTPFLRRWLRRHLQALGS